MNANAEPVYGAADWHRESYRRFIEERLPALLAERLPLTAYGGTVAADGATTVTLSVAGPGGDVETSYAFLPGPDAEGIVGLQGSRLVVVPEASDDRLDLATIRCLGEQLLAWIDRQRRLGRQDRLRRGRRA